MNILFFSPYSEIWVHSFPESLLMESFTKQGWAVDVIRCNGALQNNCVALNLAHLTSSAEKGDRDRICASCRQTRKLLTNNTNCTTTFLEQLITPDEIQKIDKLIAVLQLDSWTEFEYDDLPIGKLAAYELVLNFKISSSTVPNFVREDYKQSIRNTLMVYFALTRYMISNRPDKLVVYNSLYSLNRIAVKIAERNNVSWFSIHGGRGVNNLLSSLSIFSNTEANDLVLHSSKPWLIYEKRALHNHEIGSVKNNLESLIKARSPFVYSSQLGSNSILDLRRKLGIPEGKKIILCILGSEDERFAADLAGAMPFSIHESNGLFASDLDWVETLGSWVSTRSDYHLVVRVHPRELYNKRENHSSQRSAKFLEALSQLSANHKSVSINLPTDDISLYQLALITNLVANGTSTSGAEMMLFGLPVVCHNPDRLLSYPPNHNYTQSVNSVGCYFETLDLASQDGWSIQNSIKAFRYRSFLLNRISASIDDRIPDRNKWSLLRIAVGLRDKYNWPLFRFLIYGLRKIEKRRNLMGFYNENLFINVIKETLPNLSYCNVNESEPSISSNNEALEIAFALADLFTNALGDISRATFLSSSVQKYILLHVE